ncbi:1903_t:CDS:2, partial [Funneliformis geosporum]
GNIAKEVKEHMNPSSFISRYFSITPDLNKAKNVKLKHALEEHEARFTNLKQKDKEKATLIAKLDYDIKKIKQSLASTSSRKNMQDISACENLIKEISTSISCNTFIQNQLRGISHDIISQVNKMSLTSDQRKSDILQNIANLYEKACDVKDVSIKLIRQKFYAGVILL